MDQSELFGKVIKVNPAKPPKNVNEGLGSKTALWEQVSLFTEIYYNPLLIWNFRKDGWQRMQLVKRTSWQLRGLGLWQIDRMILCRVWRV
jgi:hypothetical protein